MKRYRRMTTAQLDELLQAELRKDLPNEEVVLPILEILENRERKPRKKNTWIVGVAAVAAVFALFITIVPKTVGANSLWDAVLHMTESVVQFFAPVDSTDPAETDYVFETNNPGLQQLYDKVVSLGITDPVVPMWLPDGYELVELKDYSFNSYEKFLQVYEHDSEKLVIVYIISNEISTTQYEYIPEQVEVYEAGRIGHAITENTGNWAVTWVSNNVEGLITANVSKENLYRIIDSIYRRN